LARVLWRLLTYSFESQAELLGGTAAGFDAGTSGGKECTGGADQSEDGGGVFRRVGAAILRVQGEGDAKEESEAEKHEGGFLH
jgi:hypothetical protein